MMKFREEHGFTLIEIMIVVVIIGLLVTLAIPNFMVMQARAKRAEARSNLSGLFVAQKAFFADHNMYTTDIREVHWTPIGTPIYLYGFCPGCKQPNGPITLADGTVIDGNRNNTLDASVLAFGEYSTGKMNAADGTLLLTTDLPPICQMTGAVWTGCAAGNIDGDLTKDAVGITERRSLLIVADDDVLN